MKLLQNGQNGLNSGVSIEGGRNGGADYDDSKKLIDQVLKREQSASPSASAGMRGRPTAGVLKKHDYLRRTLEPNEKQPRVNMQVSGSAVSPMGSYQDHKRRASNGRATTQLYEDDIVKLDLQERQKMTSTKFEQMRQKYQNKLNAASGTVSH